MPDTPKPPRKCLGYDADGKPFDCPNPPGTPWTDHWCAECDQRRLARLDAKFEALATVFGPREAEA